MMRSKPQTLLLSLPGGNPGLPNMGLEILYDDLRGHGTPCRLFRSDIIMCEHISPEIMAKIASHDAINFFYSDIIFKSLVDKKRIKKFLRLYGISAQEEKLYRNALECLDIEFTKTLLHLKPSAMAISLCSDKLIAALYFIRKAKAINPDLFTVLGGSCVDGLMGESIIKNFGEIDYIIRGRGETVLNELILRRHSGKYCKDIPGLLCLDGAQLTINPPHISRSPYKLVEMHKHYSALKELSKKYHRNAFGSLYGIVVCAARGCWWGKCDFCSWAEHEKKYAINDPCEVANYIRRISERYGFKDVYWLDQIQPPKPFLKKFYHHIKKMGLNVSIVGEFHALKCRDEDVKMLALSGWKSVQVGIESYSDDHLKKMGKGACLLDLLNFYFLCGKYEIDISGNLLEHHPAETIDDVKRNRRIIELTSHFIIPELQPYYVAEGSILSRYFDNHGYRLLQLARYRVLYPPKIRSKMRFVYRYLPVKKSALAIWRKIERLSISLRQRKPKLFYIDNGTYGTVYDSRYSRPIKFILTGLERDLILNYTAPFTHNAKITNSVQNLIKNKLLIKIGDKFVSLVQIVTSK